jgi:adenosylcobyric acid synthase
MGTVWHGLLEDDAFRRAFLAEVADAAGRRRFRVAPDTSFAALRERRLDRLADAVEECVDTRAVLDLVERGAPAGLPVVPPAGG